LRGLRPHRRRRLFRRGNADRRPEGRSAGRGPAAAEPAQILDARGIAEWLVEQLTKDAPALVGFDHGFSFPLCYFEKYGLKPNWPAFLDDFQQHWPTDDDNTYVDFVRDGARGDGTARAGNSRWRRLTEERAGGAK
jgi:hypothetical protein